MKKSAFLLALVFAFLLGVNARAAEARASGGSPVLSFTGTTATCYVDCQGNSSRDTVTATLTLYQGSTYVDSWSGTDTGSVFVYGQTSVRSGKSYRLVLTYSVNGVSQSSRSITKTCP